MKKILISLLVLLMISQTALCAAYTAYPLGDGRVEVVGSKNPDSETTFIIKDLTGTKLVDVGQVGAGGDEFSKILYISDPDNSTYNVEIGSSVVQVKNVTPSVALSELNSASAQDFENVLNTYNKIFEADTSLIIPVCDKETAYAELADKTFTAPDKVAEEYAEVLEKVTDAEKNTALGLIAQNKSQEALSKYIGLFDVDIEAFNSVTNKNQIYNILNGNTYNESEFEAAFSTVLVIAEINEASGDAYKEMILANQANIGLDLSVTSDAVFTKTDAMTFKSFEDIKNHFIEETSLNRLNNATESNVKTILEEENAVLKILDTEGYSLLSETLKNSVCQAMSRTDFATAQAARDEFKLLVQRASSGEAIAPSKPSSSGSSGGGGYAISGGVTQAPERPTGLPFTDVSASHWGYSAISSLYSQNIVSGTSDTTFEPDRQLTREEFIKMLVGIFGLYNDKAENVFADISESDWCVKYVASAYEAGLTKGKGDGTFGKGDALTRQDMAVLASRCAEIAELELGKANDISFVDEAEFASYAKDGIYALSYAGIINGVGDGKFSPNAGCTRAMAAKVCNELLELYKGGAGK